MTAVPCELTGCKEPAQNYVQWGTDLRGQAANLCGDHVREVWEMSGHAKTTGVWIQQLPKANHKNLND